MQGGGGEGVEPAGVVGAHQGRGAGGEVGRVARRQHRGGAGGQGGGDEGAAVGPRARKGGEQHAGAHGAAVGGDAGDLRVHLQVAPQQLGKPGAHLSSLAVTSSSTGLAAAGAWATAKGVVGTRATCRKPAIRSITRPATGAAFQPPRAKP